LVHSIRRQILEIELPREEGALAIQRQFAQVWQEKILPKLDELFSHLAPEGKIIRISHLELDLGQINENNWETQFIERCVEQLSKRLTVLSAQAEPSSDGDWEMLDSVEHTLEMFTFFLESGTLPWHAGIGSLKELETKLALIFADAPAKCTALVLPLLQQKPMVLRRMLWQFSPAFVEKALSSIFKLHPEVLTQALALWQEKSGAQLSFTVMENLIRALLAPTAMISLSPSTTALTLFDFWQATQANPFIAEAFVLKANSSNNTVPPKHTNTTHTPSSEAKEDLGPIPAAVTFAPNHQVSTGIRVENAGLVLLAPYLPTFFQALNLLEDKRFLHPEAQYRAIHLLHYLATGAEHPEEPWLSLPKILCGQDIEESLPLDLDLQEFEKKEAENLLQALIQNWPVLKNTSPDGLRTGFLQRMGVLSSTLMLGAKLLRIERQGQDILLERLPWGYSVIKLPWMEHSLQVEW
jgi:Contractile injection system tape measure protein